MKIAIIGGGGKMGQWLCRRLAGENREVIAADHNAEKLKEIGNLNGVQITQNNTEAVTKADIIVVSVPIGNFETVIKEISPQIRSSQIIMDVTSIKTKPVDVMHRYIKTGTILGAHPLFGPNVSSLEKQNFVLTPTNEKEKTFALKVEKYLKKRGANVKFMAPEEHDKTMAAVQGLTHFVAIIATDALSDLGELGKLNEAATTTFKSFVSYIESVVIDDAQLYAAIQMEHPRMPEIYRALERSLEKWSGFVAKKDTAGFVKGMALLKSYFEHGGKSR